MNGSNPLLQHKEISEEASCHPGASIRAASLHQSKHPPGSTSCFQVCRHTSTQVVTTSSGFVLGVDLFRQRSRLSPDFQTAGMIIAAKTSDRKPPLLNFNPFVTKKKKRRNPELAPQVCRDVGGRNKQTPLFSFCRIISTSQRTSGSV